MVDRVGRFVDVARHQHQRHCERDHGERQREQEHRPPPVVLEEDPRAERAERRDPAADRRPQGDRLRARRARPERGDQGERRRVRHAGGEAADHAGREQHVDRRRPGGEAVGGNRQDHPENQQELPPVAVADGAEVQDRGSQPQRIADRDEVELGLRRVEVLPDRGQRDVRDGKTQVRDRRDRDQRAEDELAACRSVCGQVRPPLRSDAARAPRSPRRGCAARA